LEVRPLRPGRYFARALAVLSIAAALTAGGSARAITVTVEGVAAPPPPLNIPLVRTQKPVPPPPLPRLRVTGMIETGDADKLRAVLEKLAVLPGVRADRPLGIVELSSIGGNLTEGFEIGALLRHFRMVAVVRKGDICLSSCALALLGGTFHPAAASAGACNVEIGAKVAFHSFFLNRHGLREVTADDPVASRLQGFADARGGAAMLMRYAGDMGLQPTLVANMIGRPVEDMQYLETAGQFAAFRLCPIGLRRPATTLEVQARNVCVNSVGAVSPAPVLDVQAIPAHQAKSHLLARLQVNVQAAKPRGRLAAQLASASTLRDRDEIDRLYDDLQAAGVALPDIVGPTFEVAGAQPDATCFVSLSPDNPDRYDVALFGSRGFSEPTHQPPDNARRLFLYDRGDVVNPGL
jgi:hypothetical protein